MYQVPLHLGGHRDKTNVDKGALGYLRQKYNIVSMVDIGCGPGGMVQYAISQGLRAMGVDGDPTVARDCPIIIEHDFTQGPLYLWEFDLGWSVEFVEHVDERYIPNFLATFCSCNYLFLTAAPPGQGGYHHVNCQWPEYWIARLEAVGFELDHEATLAARQHSTMWNGIARERAQVFQRRQLSVFCGDG